MSTITVSLSFDEKEKLVNFIKTKEASYSKKITAMTRESTLMAEAAQNMPINATKAFKDMLTVRLGEWKDRLAGVVGLTTRYRDLVAAIQTGKTISGREYEDVLKDFYMRQKDSSKKMEKKFEYYPRLKRAKEATLHELANKIKRIMESTDVKIA